MPTNRNNNEVSQSFAIGTKIEYMNKLFEVTESNQCCDCSLATICSSSDISTGDRNDDTLSRDKRINIFGECSSLRRPDNKSIVFVEIPNNKSKYDSKDDSKDNSKYEYYKISPLWVYNNPTQLRPIELVLPNGHEIDVESSDLSKGIIRFKRKWLSLEQLYKLVKENHYLTNRSAVKELRDGKLVALANLMDIVRYFNGDWNYDFTKGDIGYMIVYDTTMTEPHYVVRKFDSVTKAYYGNPIFKNEADAQYVIDNPNFREVLDKIFKL
jgi:hypothetical protein